LRVYIASMCSVLAWAVEGLFCLDALDALELEPETVDDVMSIGYGMMDQKLV